MSSPRFKPSLASLWRLGTLILVLGWLGQEVRWRDLLAQGQDLSPEQVSDFLPQAKRLLPPVDEAQRWQVLDEHGQLLGHAASTTPLSNRIIGYSGPSRCLLVWDRRGVLLGVRLLHSHDTPEHVAEVVADREFFTQFKGWEAAESKVPQVVSGATLTSAAIAQGVLARIGAAAGSSLKFPDPITLAEVQALEPAAAQLRASQKPLGGLEVLSKQGEVIALAVRTAPAGDAVIGYKGPSESLLLLDPQGRELRQVALRRSYDSKRYVGYVTGDVAFLKSLAGRSLKQWAEIDFKAEKIEGVSGATETSWALAEGIRRRAVQATAAQAQGGSGLRWRWQDWGHVLLIASACLMALTPWRGRRLLRHLHHALLVIYGGLVSGELLSQGLLTGWATHGPPWSSAPGLLLLAAAALLGPVLTPAQLYCHHLCPHGALQQWLVRRLPWQLQLPPRLQRGLEHLPMALLLLMGASLLAGWGWNLNAFEPFDAFVLGWAAPTALTLGLLGLLLSLFQPMAYCRLGCPTGALLRWLRAAPAGRRLPWRDVIASLLLALAWGLRQFWGV